MEARFLLISTIILAQGIRLPVTECPVDQPSDKQISWVSNRIIDLLNPLKNL
jgi:hypothetical protein